MILSWQTPLLAVLLVWLAVTWRSLTETERCLGAGVLASVLFFLFFPKPQGHGWGYRYTYAALGNLALLGTTGVERLARTLGTALARRLLVASAAVTVLVQWPVRAWQIEHYVRPFANAARVRRPSGCGRRHRRPDDVVVRHRSRAQRSVPADEAEVLSAFYLRPQDKRLLAARFGDRVHLLQPQEIAQFGVPIFPSKAKRAIWPPN